MTITKQSISPLTHIQKAIPTEATETTSRYPDVYETSSPKGFLKMTPLGDAFLLQSESGISLLLQFYSDTIVRFRYVLNSELGRDFSYAIAPDFNPSTVSLTIVESKYGINFKSESLYCIVSKSDFRVSIYDHSLQLISSEKYAFRAISTLLNGLSEVRISKVAPQNEVYYGLGDKSSSLNLREQIKENWNTDAFGFDEERDPLYRTIPFYYGLNDGIGYGIFMDNTYRSHFDFAATETNVTTFFAEGGEMNYYFIYGPSLLSVSAQYMSLTGIPELPPLWSLGFHQCRWSYFPDSRVREIAQTFRELQIPCDAIYLDIDYMDGYRCFTWNEEHFPNPKQLVDDLREDGFQTIVMIDPGLRVDENYWVYQSAIENDVLCRRVSGELMMGPVWPPKCVFPDFTKPSARSWWSNLHQELYVDQGISGFWNDMNEPAMFKVDILTFPDAVLHDFDGEQTDHRKAHNVYGIQMTKATFDGLKMLRPEKRPFLLTRATYSGGQRYAALWTGDNVANWEHLHIANVQCQRLSQSGFSFCGTDIGGFAGVPTGELMVRWLQLGIFHPFFRVHSMGNNVDGASEANKDEIEAKERLNRLDQEPWAFGDPYTQLAKAAIELRYRLLGYLYTAFWQHLKHGTPIIKSLAFYDQTDENTYNREVEFIFGDHLLICPIEKPCTPEGMLPNEEEEETEEEKANAITVTTTYEVYLPAGNWYDFYTKEVYAGKQSYSFPVELWKIPIFAKAGAVIPQYPVQQYVGEKKIEEVILQVFYAEEEVTSQLYEDAGEGYEHQAGAYSLKTFTTQGNATQFIINRQQEGNRTDTQTTYRLWIHGIPFAVRFCQVDNRLTSFTQDKDSGSIELVVASDFDKVVLAS